MHIHELVIDSAQTQEEEALVEAVKARRNI